jgi:hypothetical protein
MGKLWWLIVKRIIANRLAATLVREFVSPKTYLKQKVYGDIKSAICPMDWMFLVAFGAFSVVVIVEVLYMLLLLVKLLVESVAALVGVWTHHAIEWSASGQVLHFGPSIICLWAISIALVIIAAVLWGVQIVKRLIPVQTQNHRNAIIWSWVIFGSGILLHSTLVLA